MFSTKREIIAHMINHYDGNTISASEVPGATNGNTSSSGSIGISITVATSLDNAALIALCQAHPLTVL